MKSEFPVVLSLKRDFNAVDEQAISHLLAQWLVYDVEINRKRSNTEIKLYHSTGAKPDLLRELGERFPGENLISS